MTDLSPSVEIVLTSDLFNDDPAIEFLSPAALAVLDAYMTGYGWLDGPTKKDCRGVAAALRAAADHLAYIPADSWTRVVEENDFLTIADELEAL